RRPRRRRRSRCRPDRSRTRSSSPLRSSFPPCRSDGDGHHHRQIRGYAWSGCPSTRAPVIPSPVSLRAVRQELLERTDLHGDDFCHALSDATDTWLAGLLHHATGGDTHGIGLVAVGGYGRGELAPGSDLDVVLVYERRRDIGAIADAVWYPVWDEGVRLDHSVRRPGEVL